jgi:SWI/SNF-related matrix-associated actin-dependent regulator of chromatin subfamily A member 5
LLFFFNVRSDARLDELRNKEAECYQKILALHSKCESENTWEGYEASKKELEDQFGLVATERTEVQSLMEGGFSNWNKRDFNNFIRACEMCGRDDFDAIASHVEGKTPDEVKKYHAVFFARYKEIDGWEKIMKNIEKNERMKQRVGEVQRLLEDRVKKTTDPELSLKIPSSVAQKRGFVDENDRFLIVQLHRLGYGSDQTYKDIQLEIRKAPKFRFDYYFK